MGKQVSRGGQLLREWRDRNEYSQFAAGQILSMPAQQISRYENGGTPGLRIALRFAERTGGSVYVKAWDEVAMVAHPKCEPVAANG